MMTGVSVQDFCAAIYCAQTSAVSFAVGAAGRIAVIVRSLDQDSEDYYRLEFDSVREFSWKHDRPLREGRDGIVDPNDRLEFSAIEVEGSPGEWRVWINPWYCSVIEFRCTRICINGAEVIGEGRWFQDELPVHHPSIPPFPTA